jgi:hypothetical protein
MGPCTRSHDQDGCGPGQAASACPASSLGRSPPEREVLASRPDPPLQAELPAASPPGPRQRSTSSGRPRLHQLERAGQATGPADGRRSPPDPTRRVRQPCGPACQLRCPGWHVHQPRPDPCTPRICRARDAARPRRAPRYRSGMRVDPVLPTTGAGCPHSNS